MTCNQSQLEITTSQGCYKCKGKKKKQILRPGFPGSSQSSASSYECPLWVTRALPDITLLPPHLFLKLGTRNHLAIPPSTSPFKLLLSLVCVSYAASAALVHAFLHFPTFAFTKKPSPLSILYSLFLSLRVRQGFTLQPKMAWNSLCSSAWFQTQANAPALPW